MEQRANIALRLLNVFAAFLGIVGGASDLPERFGIPYVYILWLIVVATALTLASVIALILEKMQKKGFLLPSFLFAFVIAGLGITLTNVFAEQFESPSPISVVRVKHDLTIDGEGRGIVHRTRFLKARERTNCIYETDWSSDGGPIDTAQFKFELYECSEDQQQRCVQPYQCIPTQWISALRQLRCEFNPWMESGKHYEQVLIWTSEGAFTDSQGDYFTVNVNVPTKEQGIIVHLRNGRQFDTARISFDRVKRKGHVTYGEPAPGDIVKQSDEIRWTILRPKVGDRYHIQWQYLPEDTLASFP